MADEKQDGRAADQPDDAVPSVERQAELEAACQANVAEGKPPYYAVKIRTRGELRWVMETHGWSGNFMLEAGQERANLAGADLARANLAGARLGGTNLSSAYLTNVILVGAYLAGADLSSVTLSGADLAAADLARTNLAGARLLDANLASVRLRGANLLGAELWGVMLSGADLGRAALAGVNLTKARLSGADLGGADLSGANLNHADLSDAYLVHADLTGAVLEEATLTGADLRRCRLDVTTQLAEASLDATTRLADVVWNDAPLTRVTWETVPALGDEAEARRPKSKQNNRKDSVTRLDEFTDAAHAYRQLAVALRSQGLNEYADNYAYRGQLMQRVVLRRQAFLRQKDRKVSLWNRLRRLAAYAWSWVLWALAGYGYRPGRSILAYLLLIGGFAVAYHTLGAPAGHPAYHLSWLESVVVSLTAFHGRGFFAQQYSPGDPQSILAAGEAVVGLLVEIIFIATFTNRFFAR